MKITNHAEATGCAELQPQLDGYLSQELAAPVRRACEAHLARCAECATALAARQQVKQALQQAVASSAPAPAAFRARLRRELAQQQQPASRWTWRRWWLVPATAALVCGVLGLGLLRWPAQPHAPVTLAPFNPRAANAQVLQIGLHNHLHCALGGDYSAGPPGLETMARELGPQFAQLLPVVQQHVPAGHQIVSAHQCQFAGRDYLHFVLAHEQTLLSLVLTAKNGAAFTPEPAGESLRASGIPIHHMRAEQLEVAGFEAAEYLAFVVSNLGETSNGQLAAQLAPAVRAFMTRLAG
jgi:hypothetical protein